ncbi:MULTISPECIES: hypothetical protein [Sphingobium]|uniref:hypothetical protein n=1 Tax=Sphingobium TaxID=165695 RepID=UPI00159C28AC|nr:hypothetical protein [Sphingobium sp. 15-1]
MADMRRYELLSDDWVAMQEREVVAAFARSDWPDAIRFSLVERFVGAAPLPNGLVAGFRVDVAGSKAIYRRGAAADETGDVTVDMTIDALNELVHMSSNDPGHAAAVERFIQSGDIMRKGEFEPLAAVSKDVHHRIHLQTL